MMMENLNSYISHILLLYLSIEDFLYKEITFIILLLFLIVNKYYILIILSIILLFVSENGYIGNGDIPILIMYFYNKNSILILYIISFIFSCFTHKIPLITCIYISILFGLLKKYFIILNTIMII